MSYVCESYCQTMRTLLSEGSYPVVDNVVPFLNMILMHYNLPKKYIKYLTGILFSFLHLFYIQKATYVKK